MDKQPESFWPLILYAGLSIVVLGAIIPAPKITFPEQANLMAFTLVWIIFVSIFIFYGLKLRSPSLVILAVVIGLILNAAVILFFGYIRP